MFTVEEALGIILKDAPAPRILETDLAQSAGHVLAEACASDLDMPPFDRSMMDGYALRSGESGPFRVIEEVPAGRVPSREVVPGTCAKVMTGAPVPAGADAVQQVEKTRRDGDQMLLLDPVRRGQNIAPRASEVHKGQVVLAAGHRIRPAEVGVLAALGRTRVRVFARPRCAVLATGDELVPPEALPGPGQIRNSNTSSVGAQVRELGLECRDLGIAPDEPHALREAIHEGLRHDLLLLSGGVSAGDWDLVIPALEAEGVRIALHHVRIKPGRPFCFAPGVFGLPGNPVSAFVIFEVFVRPYLGRCMGADLARPRVRARLESAPPRPNERVQYLPADVRYEEGGYVAETVPWKGSADLFALARSNAFVIIPAGTAPDRGSPVDCMLLGAA